MSATKRLIHSARIFDGQKIVEDGWLIFDSRVLDLGTGETWKKWAAETEGVEVLDLQGQLISPAMIDTHTHGGGGDSVEDGIDAMRRILDFEAAHGVGWVILSLVSNSIDGLKANLRAARELQIADDRLLGIHLEGPFLAHSHKGAHNPEVLITPTVETVAELIAAGDGAIHSITLAPELASPEVFAQLSAANITICVGHTNIDYEGAKAAFASGAKVLTHAFNGMNGIHHRAPGPVVAAIDTDQVWLELIADGVHVDPAVALLLPASNLILVTDSMAAAGMADGDYRLGELAVQVVDGVARVQTGSIAGSTLTLDRAVLNYKTWSGSEAAPLAAVTSNPASAYGLTELGAIRIGAKAKFALWGADGASLIV